MNALNHFAKALGVRRPRLSLAALFLAALSAGALAQTGPPVEYGARIVSRQTYQGARLCLALVDTTDRSRVGLRPCTEQTADQAFLWKITRRAGGGVYITAASRAEERRMEVADFGTGNGALVQIWGPNALEGYRPQAWDFFPVAGGVMIVNINSGKCLNVPLGRNPLDQELVQQFTCARAANDTWVIEPVYTRPNWCPRRARRRP
jgi:hypothetical protein